MSRSVGIVPGEAPAIGSGSPLADFARQLWWERRLRNRYFPDEIFGDPNWDLLLDVYAAQVADEPVRLRKAYLSACVPPATAERLSRALVQLGILVAERVRTDRRSLQLTLSRLAQSRFEHLLQSMLSQRFVQPANGISGRTVDREQRGILINTLNAIRDELDQLELWEVGAHLSQAITALERG